MLFPLMGSSDWVKTKQKQNGITPQYTNHISPLSRHRNFVALTVERISWDQ